MSRAHLNLHVASGHEDEWFGEADQQALSSLFHVRVEGGRSAPRIDHRAGSKDLT